MCHQWRALHNVTNNNHHIQQPVDQMIQVLVWTHFFSILRSKELARKTGLEAAAPFEILR